MTEDATNAADLDVGEYCRRVEDHLTRANLGHLVRIVGRGFDLVRQWAESGVPLRVVCRGIDIKAERHREGQSRRPLRIEFCESDVMTIFENWRRAIGVAPPPEADTSAKRPSLSKHLDRAIDRLSKVAGRLDLPDALRDTCDAVMQDLAELKAAAIKVRGTARQELAERLPALDARLADTARTHAPAAMRDTAMADAVEDLAAFRDRLGGDEWRRSVDVTADRLLRDRLGLPVLEL